MKKTNELINEIRNIILENVKVDFESVFYSIKIVCTISESNAKMINTDAVKSFSVKFKDQNGKAIHPDLVWQLRDVMYFEASDKGAWYIMNMAIHKDGNFDCLFDYDTKPAFSISLEDFDFIKDYQKYPRGREFMPDWLLDILIRNQLL